jgi:phosphoribosylanthranilate isomerase
MPSGPGVITEDEIAEIAATIPPPIGSFLLTSRQNVDSIIEQHRRCRTNCIQLCDRLTSGTTRELKAALPGIAVVQVIHVTGPESVQQACTVAESVDAILLDSGNPALKIKELGGTARRNDWTLSREIRERVHVPLFLAGGLTESNVAEAIEATAPFGLDLCSGVRTDGKLDKLKLSRFFAAVQAAASR